MSVNTFPIEVRLAFVDKATGKQIEKLNNYRPLVEGITEEDVMVHFKAWWKTKFPKMPMFHSTIAPRSHLHLTRSDGMTIKPYEEEEEEELDEEGIRDKDGVPTWMQWPLVFMVAFESYEDVGFESVKGAYEMIKYLHDLWRQEIKAESTSGPCYYMDGPEVQQFVKARLQVQEGSYMLVPIINIAGELSVLQNPFQKMQLESIKDQLKIEQENPGKTWPKIWSKKRKIDQIAV